MAVRPNPGHDALAAAEAKMGDRFLLATQNVDGLHRRAGSARLVEIHGNLFETRCSRCRRETFHDEREYLGEPPPCEECEARGAVGLLRPNIVWFGEMLDPINLQRISTFIEDARGKRLVFLAVGTSGVVYPAAGLVLEARAAGGRGVARQRRAARQRARVPPLRPRAERPGPARPVRVGLRLIEVLLAAAIAAPPPAAFDLRSLERPRVLAAALAFLKEEPVTVTASSSPRSTCGRHDFFSEGDYWWPDPATPAAPTCAGTG